MRKPLALFPALVLPFALALGLTAPGAARAFCGFYVSGADGSVYNEATKVVLMRQGRRTVLSMQNAYQGPPQDFAMVVPVPVVLQETDVKALPRAAFDRVDQLSEDHQEKAFSFPALVRESAVAMHRSGNREGLDALGDAIPAAQAVIDSL